MRIEYKLQEWNGGKVWVEEAYPNILFAKDGEIYDIAGIQERVHQDIWEKTIPMKMEFL